MTDKDKFIGALHDNKVEWCQAKSLAAIAWELNKIREVLWDIYMKGTIK